MKLLKELNEASNNLNFSTKEFADIKRRVAKDEELTDDQMAMMQEFVMEHDPSWMPYGTQKARDGDPYEWIYNHMDEIVSAIAKNARLT